MNQERHKTEWEERIRFVARYYRENVFDPEIGWKNLRQNGISEAASGYLSGFGR